MFGPFGCVLHYEPCNICAVLLALVIGWPFTMCCWGRRRAGFVREPALTMVQIQQQDCLPVHQATGMAQQQQQQTTIVLPRIAGGAAATAVNYPAAQQTMNPLAANQKPSANELSPLAANQKPCWPTNVQLNMGWTELEYRRDLRRP